MKITIIEDYHIPFADVYSFRIQCENPTDKYKPFFTNNNIYLGEKIISRQFYESLKLQIVKKLKHKDKVWAIQNLQSKDSIYKLLSNLIIDNIEIEWLIPESYLKKL